MSRESKAPKRDARVDHIGWAKELYDRFVKPLRVAVAGDYPSRTQLEGDHFTGLIIGPTWTDVSPEAWLKLYQGRKITRAQFLAAISVSVEAARDTVDAPTFVRISKSGPGDKYVAVRRRGGVEPALVEAVRKLGEGVAPVMPATDVTRKAA